MIYAGVLGAKPCKLDVSQMLRFLTQIPCQDGKPYSQVLGALLAGYLPQASPF